MENEDKILNERDEYYLPPVCLPEKIEESKIYTPIPIKKRKNTFVIVLGLSLILLLVLICIFTLTGKEQQSPQTDLPISEATDAWKGAFLNEEIYRSCFDSSVVIRVERGNGDDCWTGVVISEDGWIATSLEAFDTLQNGRLYVITSDGGEYKVDAIYVHEEGSLAFLKIGQSKLSTATFSDRNIQNGERIISICACPDNVCRIAYGEISRVGELVLGANVSLGKYGTGAPIFDESGELLAILSSSGDGDTKTQNNAFFAKEVKEIFFSTCGSEK